MALFSTPYKNNSRIVSGTITVNNDDVVLLCNTSSAPVIINLAEIPSEYFNIKYRLFIKDNSNNASVNNITINAPAGFKINNASSVILSTNGVSVVIEITSNTDYLLSANSSLGTVTSVSSGGLSPLFTVNVSTPTTTPAISFTAVSQAANLIYASPATGAAAAPTFRSLVEADIPTISLTTKVSGVLPVANGGTGTSTQFTPGSVIFAGASGVYTEDNANFFWDDTNNRLGIGINTPVARLQVDYSQNAFSPVGQFNNLSTGSSAVSAIGIAANVSGIEIGALGSNCTGFPTYGEANSTHIYTSNTGTGVNIIKGLNTTTPGLDYIRFYPGFTVDNLSGSVLSLINTRKVGINKDVPAYALDVVGDIITSTLYRVGGVAGFTGTGAYTNFTIVGGIITAAS